MLLPCLPHRHLRACPNRVKMRIWQNSRNLSAGTRSVRKLRFHGSALAFCWHDFKHATGKSLRDPSQWLKKRPYTTRHGDDKTPKGSGTASATTGLPLGNPSLQKRHAAFKHFGSLNSGARDADSNPTDANQRHNTAVTMSV